MPQIFVSIGSNINKAHHIRAAVNALQTHYGELQLSPVYESEAVGFEGDTFYNLVANFHTDTPALATNQVLTSIENAHGRDRDASRFSARTLDIDLLLYGDTIINTATLTLPRVEITANAFILLPLVELAPQLRDPITQTLYRDHWRTFDKIKQKLWKITLEFNHGTI